MRGRSLRRRGERENEPQQRERLAAAPPKVAAAETGDSALAVHAQRQGDAALTGTQAGAVESFVLAALVAVAFRLRPERTALQDRVSAEKVLHHQVLSDLWPCTHVGGSVHQTTGQPADRMTSNGKDL